MRTLEGMGLSPLLGEAVLKIPREAFVPEEYRDYAYSFWTPLALPGPSAISPLFVTVLTFEVFALGPGGRFLEVGSGSGYTAALAWEVVGPAGMVVSMEIDPGIFSFARDNLARLGYSKIVMMPGDGSVGYPTQAPYDAILMEGAAPQAPQPLLNQLAVGGRLVAPLGEPGRGYSLTLITREGDSKWEKKILCPLKFEPPLLKGQFCY